MKWPWNKEERAEDVNITQVDDILLRSMLSGVNITKEQALNIPSVKGCISFIADTVAMLPIKLYKEDGTKTSEVLGDNRIKLLNDDTGDTLDANQFWRAIVTDYFLGKGGYAYINRRMNKIMSIHYVNEENISISKNLDPIFKSYKINVYGQSYWPHDFIKILRNTKDGASGKSIIEENALLLSVAYNSLVYEETLVKKGGNKKGFLKAQKRLTEDAINALKAAWSNLYSNNSENVVVLNEGLEFQEASNTSVEMQLNENKESNAIELCKLFNVPVTILKGNATSQEYSSAFKLAVMPLLKAIECALNRDILLESEKKSFYFAFDTKEMLKGNIKERFEAYKIAIDANFMGVDEVRFMEDLPAFGIDWIKLGLDSVLYNPTTKEIYTPNTNAKQNMGNLGGDDSEN